MHDDWLIVAQMPVWVTGVRTNQLGDQVPEGDMVSSPVGSVGEALAFGSSDVIVHLMHRNDRHPGGLYGSVWPSRMVEQR
jgi:hypothetical protein